jgi:hypothetical protein
MINRKGKLSMIKKSQTIKTSLEITPKPDSPIMKLIEQTGIKGIVPDVVKAIMSPLINLIANRDGDDVGSPLNKSITLIAASDPKNQSELMLATQLAMAFITLGKSTQLLDQNYKDVKTINSLGNLYTKLSRLGIDQINTLERMKGKSQQKIIVEKVNIEAGGQADIGVYEGVGANAKKGL